ncbi:glucan biosynthesis protein [Bradyrhizobium sp. CIR48]|nr:glucan biosynthesis protein [Bradyrhizobium sp. CIR48]
MVIHALLDSKSCAASYRFTVRPGETTVFDVEMSVYPRVEMQRAGLAPMTSTFFYGPNDATISTTSARRSTIPTASRSSTGREKASGGRSTIPAISRSARFRI